MAIRLLIGMHLAVFNANVYPFHLDVQRIEEFRNSGIVNYYKLLGLGTCNISKSLGEVYP